MIFPESHSDWSLRFSILIVILTIFVLIVWILYNSVFGYFGLTFFPLFLLFQFIHLKAKNCFWHSFWHNDKRSFILQHSTSKMGRRDPSWSPMPTSTVVCPLFFSLLFTLNPLLLYTIIHLSFALIPYSFIDEPYHLWNLWFICSVYLVWLAFFPFHFSSPSYFFCTFG